VFWADSLVIPREPDASVFVVQEKVWDSVSLFWGGAARNKMVVSK